MLNPSPSYRRNPEGSIESGGSAMGEVSGERAAALSSVRDASRLPQAEHKTKQAKAQAISLM